MKKAISIFFCLCILICNTNIATARASDYISTYNISIGMMGNGIVLVSATVNATKPTMTTVGFPTINLYEYNGSAWKLVASRYNNYNPNATSGSYGYDFNYQGKVGYKYYAYANFYVAKSGEGSDIREADSVTLVAV